MKYYYDLLSQPCRAIYIFLNKNKIDFQKVPVSIFKGEQKKAQVASVYPIKTLPALEDGDLKLGESVAIFRYLINKYGDQIADHWYPKDPRKQAKVDEYLEWQHTNTRFNCVMYFMQKLVIPIGTRSPPNKKNVEIFKSKMEKVLDQIDTIWLKESKFIAGDEISIADLMAICELQQPGVVGYKVYEGRPALAAWNKRVNEIIKPELDEASANLLKLQRVYPLLNIWLVGGGTVMKTLGLSKEFKF